jgi:excisionase family DNA binding protein
MPSNNRLLTVQEVAGELRVSANTVRQWAREGRIDSITLPGNVRHKHLISEETLDSLKRDLPQSTTNS